MARGGGQFLTQFSGPFVAQREQGTHEFLRQFPTREIAKIMDAQPPRGHFLSPCGFISRPRTGSVSAPPNGVSLRPPAGLSSVAPSEQIMARTHPVAACQQRAGRLKNAAAASHRKDTRVQKS